MMWSRSAIFHRAEFGKFVSGDFFIVCRFLSVRPLLFRHNRVVSPVFLEEQCKVERLEKQVAALTAGLQKVSAQIEANKPVGQTVMN
jgi:hypothetical protein